MAKIFKAKQKQDLIGKVVACQVERLDLNGDGVSYYNKKPMFVDGALPKEQVKARITEQKSKYLRAKAIDIVEPSATRVKPLCAHVQNCGGCDLQHLDYPEQVKFKQSKVTELFSRNAGVIDLPWHQPLISREREYRRRARIGVQYNKQGQAIVGFRQRSAKHVIDIKHCPVLISPFNDLFTPLKTLLDKLTISSVSHLEVIGAEPKTIIFRLFKALKQADIALLAEFEQSSACKVLLQTDSQITQLDGQLANKLNDQLTIDGQHYQIEFTTKSFIQVNSELNRQMVEQALAWLAPDSTDTVLDLFCGLGNFALPLAAKCLQVIGVEGVDDMVNQAKANAMHNQLTNIHFHQADLNEYWLSASWFEPYKERVTKAILDPARAGAKGAVEQLIKLNLKQLVYVSCDPATLARDSAILLEHGYQIDKIALMDMFAQTKHIETMVSFSKVS
jgi:23S rRNA (uracil1939-C5)-methyltransferase